jgi:hypothetical protein
VIFRSRRDIESVVDEGRADGQEWGLIREDSIEFRDLYGGESNKM